MNISRHNAHVASLGFTLQDATRIVPLSDLHEYFKFCQSGPSSLPKTSKVAEIARALQKSPMGSPMRGRSPSPGGFSPPPLNLDGSDLQDAVEEQRTLVLRKIITGFKFVAASPVCPDSPTRLVYMCNYQRKATIAKHTRRQAARALNFAFADSSSGDFCCPTSGRHRPSPAKRRRLPTRLFRACRSASSNGLCQNPILKNSKLKT